MEKELEEKFDYAVRQICGFFSRKDNPEFPRPRLAQRIISQLFEDVYHPRGLHCQNHYMANLKDTSDEVRQRLVEVYVKHIINNGDMTKEEKVSALCTLPYSTTEDENGVTLMRFVRAEENESPSSYTKPGRALARIVGLKDNEFIKSIVSDFQGIFDRYELRFAVTPDEVEKVYTDGPSSCMKKSRFASENHPARMYGMSQDTVVAYLYDKLTKHIVCRSVCSIHTDKLRFFTMYGYQDVMKQMFKEIGAVYDPLFLKGATLVPEYVDELITHARVDAPYLDGYFAGGVLCLKDNDTECQYQVVMPDKHELGLFIPKIPKDCMSLGQVQLRSTTGRVNVTKVCSHCDELFIEANGEATDNLFLAEPINIESKLIFCLKPWKLHVSHLESYKSTYRMISFPLEGEQVYVLCAYNKEKEFHETLQKQFLYATADYFHELPVTTFYAERPEGYVRVEDSKENWKLVHESNPTIARCASSGKYYLKTGMIKVGPQYYAELPLYLMDMFLVDNELTITSEDSDDESVRYYLETAESLIGNPNTSSAIHLQMLFPTRMNPVIAKIMWNTYKVFWQDRYIQNDSEGDAPNEDIPQIQLGEYQTYRPYDLRWFRRVQNIGERWNNEVLQYRAAEGGQHSEGHSDEVLDAARYANVPQTIRVEND